MVQVLRGMTGKSSRCGLTYPRSTALVCGVAWRRPRATDVPSGGCQKRAQRPPCRGAETLRKRTGETKRLKFLFFKTNRVDYFPDHLTRRPSRNIYRSSGSGKGRVASVFVTWSWMRVGRHDVAPRKCSDIGPLRPAERENRPRLEGTDAGKTGGRSKCMSGRQLARTGQCQR